MKEFKRWARTIIPLVFMMLLPKSALSLDHLVPCSYLLSTAGGIHDLVLGFDKALKAVFIERYHDAKAACSMITSSLFHPEKTVTIYEDSDGKFVVESLGIAQNILSILSDKRISGDHTPLDMNALKIVSHKRAISGDLGSLACTSCRHMVSDATIPKEEGLPDKSDVGRLETVFRFVSAKDGCGIATYFEKSGRIDRLVEIGDLLDDYSKAKKEDAKSLEEMLRAS